MTSEHTLATRSDYREWLGQLKTRFRQVQLKAAVAVNRALLQFYWELGADIVARQQAFAWGSGFLNQLSADLVRDFPEVKGFSPRNLKYIRQWHLFWQGAAIWQQAVAQLQSIPWGHNLAIIAKSKQPEEALYYVQAALQYGCPRRCAASCPALSSLSGNWDSMPAGMIRRKLGGLGYEF